MLRSSSSYLFSEGTRTREDCMDATELLSKQHREMEQLFDRYDTTSTDEEKLKLFARVADELAVHITTEEQIFYPAVKARRTEDILLESLEEHLSLKRLLADLITLDPSEQTFEPKFKVLKEQAEHHHEEEEEHLFPKVKRILDAAQLEALGTEIAAAQSELKEHDTPREMVITQTEAAAPLE